MPERDIIAITGHRDYPDRAALFRGLDSMSAREYVFGGARGIDTDALRYISETQPQSIKTVVVPNSVINQPAISQTAIDRYATNIIELKNTGTDCYMIRNRFMVERSTRVSAFYDFRGSGGTYNTINYARLIGKDLTVFPLEEFDVAEIQARSYSEFEAWVKEMREFKVDLRSIKGIIIDTIYNIHHTTTQDFLSSLNHPDLNTLEQFFSY